MRCKCLPALAADRKQELEVIAPMGGAEIGISPHERVSSTNHPSIDEGPPKRAEPNKGDLRGTK